MKAQPDSQIEPRTGHRVELPAQLSSMLQDVQCSDFGYGMRAALHVELTTDIEDVFFHRVDAQDQMIGDLTVGRAIDQQAQHLALTCSE